MRWKKHGLIFKPRKSDYWMLSHAALPTPLYLQGSVYRVYFSSRDNNNYAYIGYFDYDIERKKVVKVSDSPVVSPGPLGFFDGQGAQATSVNKINNRIYLYYLGWNKGSPEPLFYTSIGLAISDDGGDSFSKYSRAPIIDRSEHDPWMVSGGTVVEKNGQYFMLYLSGQRALINGNAETEYDIRIAYSDDGLIWNRNGDIALGLEADETNISRVTIIKEGDTYRGWYPVKRKNIGYRVGYAESTDLVEWDRKRDAAEMRVSEEGWDSKAIDKMAVIIHQKKKYMFYNGNNFGYDGIGLAELIDE